MNENGDVVSKINCDQIGSVLQHFFLSLFETLMEVAFFDFWSFIPESSSIPNAGIMGVLYIHYILHDLDEYLYDTPGVCWSKYTLIMQIVTNCSDLKPISKLACSEHNRLKICHTFTI